MLNLELFAENLVNLTDDELKKLAAILLHDHAGKLGLTNESGDPIPPDPTHPHP